MTGVPDIVTELRNLGWPTCHEAADRIKRLETALRNIIAGNGGECGCAETARAALEPKP
jgi:hypothetical protein